MGAAEPYTSVCSVSFWPVKLGIFLSSALEKRERYEPKLIESVHQEPLQERSLVATVSLLMSLSGVYVTPLPSYLLCISAKCCSNHLYRRLDINGVSCLACVPAVTTHPWPTITQQHKFHLDQAGIQHCIYATSAIAHCGACDSSGGFCWLWEDRCQLSCHTIMSGTATQYMV